MSQLVSRDLDQPGSVVAAVDPLEGSAPLDPVPSTPSLALVSTGPVAGRRRSDRGLVSAEWAMAIIAAVAIVGVLVAVLSTDMVKSLIGQVISSIVESFLDNI